MAKAVCNHSIHSNCLFGCQHECQASIFTNSKKKDNSFLSHASAYRVLKLEMYMKGACNKDARASCTSVQFLLGIHLRSISSEERQLLKKKKTAKIRTIG